MFQQFKNTTDELTINNQKIVLSEMEQFVTQKDTVPAKEIGIKTGNIKAPFFTGAVPNEQGNYNFYKCCNIKHALKLYDQFALESEANNKVGFLPRAAMHVSSLLGVDYGTDQCVQITSPEALKSTAKMMNIPEKLIAQDLSNTNLLPIKTHALPETPALPESPNNSPQNSPKNIFTNW